MSKHIKPWNPLLFARTSNQHPDLPNTTSKWTSSFHPCSNELNALPLMNGLRSRWFHHAQMKNIIFQPMKTIGKSTRVPVDRKPWQLAPLELSLGYYPRVWWLEKRYWADSELFFFRPTPSWLPPGRYTRSIAAKRWIVIIMQGCRR